MGITAPFTKVAFVDFVEDNSSMKVRLFAQASLSGLMLLVSAVARPADAAGLPLSTITTDGVLVMDTSAIESSPEDFTIFTVHADGTDKTTITGPGNYSASWTPDDQIIYLSYQSGQSEIWLMNDDGTGAHQIGNLTGVDPLPPQMARNGLIAFETSSATGSTLMTMKSDGSDVTTVPLPSGMDPESFSLAPSGGWIVFMNQTTNPYDRELWRVNIDGTGLQQLTFPTNPAYPDANAPSISPDGTEIVFYYGKAADAGAAGFSQSIFTFGERNIAVMSATGGPITILTQCTPVTTPAQLDSLSSSDCIAADGPSWTPDGGGVVYLSVAPGVSGTGTWLISADGQDAQLLLPYGVALHGPLMLTPLTVSSGTLDLGGATQTEAGGLLLTGGTVQNGTLSTDVTFVLEAGTVSAVLAGAGALIKSTDDTVTLSGANTYSGDTYVQAGTLVLSGAGTLGVTTGSTTVSGGTLDLGGTTQTQNGGVTLEGGTIQNGTLVSSGTFDLQDGTVSAVLAGAGAVSKSTADTVTLSGVNTYSGGTTVTAGTLQISGSGTLGAATGTLGVSGGTLDLGRTSQATGALTLTGGTIQNGTLTSQTFDVEAGTVSAVLAGTGALTKSGTGTVILSTANSYSGATNVNAGTLEVDGSIMDSLSVNVNAGGALSGIGTIDPATTTIAKGGTLAPGNQANPTGTLTITGNLAFQSGASYAVQITPSGAGSTNVNGTATLAGTVSAAFASGSYTVGQYRILQSEGVNGTTFTGLTTTNAPPNFTESLSYTTGDVLLKLTAALGANVSLTDNQQNAADAIDGFFNNGGTLPPRLAALYDRSGEQLTTALSQLSGEAATDAEVGAFALTDQFLRLMLDPFVDGRSGSDWPTGGFGQALGFAPEAPASPPPNLALGYAGMLKAPPKAIFEQRWSAWGSSFGGSTTTSGDATVGSNSVTASDYGYAGGMDYHFSPDAIAGFALGGGGTSWGLAQALGGGRSDAFQAGVYTKTNFGPAYVAAALSFANHWMNTNRIALGDQLAGEFSRPELCRPHRSWIPLCHALRHRSDALPRPAVAELSYAGLQRDRRDRRQPCAVLQRQQRDRHQERTRRLP